MFFVADTTRQPPPEWSVEVWQRLWELRQVTPLTVVLPTVVSSPCPLLPAENANALLTPGQVQVPLDTAWIPAEIDVCRYARGNGEIHVGRLEAALKATIDNGERRHDTTAWSSAPLQHDSWLNRRLAVVLRGWGDLVRLRGADPTQFKTLCELQELADFICTTLAARSRALAADRGYCPSLDRAGAKILREGFEMNARWRRAVGANALRHRNLVAMSPWDVFPAGEPADPGFMNLLPLLAHADSVAFRRDVDIGHWNVNEFKSFYERTSAILRSNSDAQHIAKQV